MADDRKIKLVLKSHGCERLGELVSWSSFDATSKVNDVGEAVLVAGYGASTKNDLLLDELDTADIILEAYIKPPGETRFLDDPAWAGFLRDRKIVQDGPAKVGTYTFKDYNHLLARRQVQPPESASHDEGYGNIGNVMRQFVRDHCGADADDERQFSGLSVEGDVDVEETGGLYTGDETIQVFGDDLPVYVRVNVMFEWNGYLYIGTEAQPTSALHGAIYRADADGTTWTKVYDGFSLLYDQYVTGIHSFAVFNGHIYAGCSQDYEEDGAVILRSADGETWAPVTSFPNLAGIWALEVYDGKLYAGTTGGNYYGYINFGSQTYIWSSDDGEIWDSFLSSSSFSLCSSIFSHNDIMYYGLGRTNRTEVYRYDGVSPIRIFNISNLIVFQGGGLRQNITHLFRVITDMVVYQDRIYICLGRTRDYGIVGRGYKWKHFQGRVYRADLPVGSSGDIWELVFGAVLGPWEEVDNGWYGSATVRRRSWTRLEELCHSISSIIQSVDNDGNSVLLVGTGRNDNPLAKIFMSSDGDDGTWELIKNLSEIPYNFVLDLIDFNGQKFAATGCYGYTEAWQADHGDVWRIALSADVVEEAGASARWTSLLNTLKELSEKSKVFDFGIVGFDSFLYCNDSVQNFEFKVRTPQWGTDNSWNEATGEGVVLAIDRKNLSAVQYEQLRGNKPNTLYVLGAGSGEERQIFTVFDTESSSKSPWNRVEGTVDGQGNDFSETLQTIGNSVLAEYGPQTILALVINETDTFHYKGGFDLGDILTVYFNGQQVDYKIMEVRLLADDGDAVYQVEVGFEQA